MVLGFGPWLVSVPKLRGARPSPLYLAAHAMGYIVVHITVYIVACVLTNSVVYANASADTPYVMAVAERSQVSCSFSLVFTFDLCTC